MGVLKDIFDIVKETFEVGSKVSEVKKNDLEMLKTTLEINELQAKAKEPSVIRTASFEQIEKYDEKTRRIREQLERLEWEFPTLEAAEEAPLPRKRYWVLLVIAVAVLLIFLSVFFKRASFGGAQ